jgi:hypothetical protein
LEFGGEVKEDLGSEEIETWRKIIIARQRETQTILVMESDYDDSIWARENGFDGLGCA